MGKLAYPSLVITTTTEQKERMIAFVNKIAPNLEILADLATTKKAPAVLFLGRRKPKKGGTWSCEACTFLNTDPKAMLCIMCDLPRNLADWAGFSGMASGGGGGAAGAGVGGHTDVTAADVYRDLVKVVKALSKCEALYRVFENGSVYIVSHLARSLDELQEAFDQQIHGEEVPVPDEQKVRVRIKQSLRDVLLAGYKNEAGGIPAGCRLASFGYNHVFNAVEIAGGSSAFSGSESESGGDLDANADAPAAPAAGAGDDAQKLYAYGTVIAEHDFQTLSPINKPVPTEYSKGNAAVVNRAYYKMAEIAVHSKLVRESLANNPTSSVGLDIGASPGGWTAYLAERCNQVIAVDPAEMDEGVKAKPNVVHIKAMLLDKTLDGVAFQAGSEGTDQLAALQEAFTQTYDSIAAEAGAGITLVCCDVNKQPEEAAEISLRALPLMAEGGVFVITAKFSTRCKEKEQAQLLEAKKVLEEHCDQIEEHWLFSNTKHERTLVARFRGKSTFAGAKAKAAASSKGAAGSSGWVSGMNAGGGGGGKGGMKAAKKAAAAEQAMVQAPKYFGTLARMKRVAANRQSKLYIVMENPQNCWNAAAATRTCDAFGVTEMLYVWPEEPIFDPAGKELSPSSCGANQWVKMKGFKTVQEVDEYIQSQEGGGAKPVHYATSGHSQTSVGVYDADFVGGGAAGADAAVAAAPPVAVWFGNETRGLSAPALALASQNVHIEMRGMAESVNLSVAVAIVLGEVTRQRKVSGHNFGFDAAGQEALVAEMATRHKIDISKGEDGGAGVE